MGSSSSIKLVSLNIEGDKHIPQVLAFLKKEQPEVLCLQEVFVKDFEMFKQELGMQGLFAPVAKFPSFHTNTPPFSPNGVALLSSMPLYNLESAYYYGGPSQEPLQETFVGDSKDVDTTKHWGVLAKGDIQKDDNTFPFATTHFTWTPDGKADDRQREHVGKLLEIVGDSPVILCGDFNAPRGGEIFAELAKRYKDNIPQKYTTSIDGDIHRRGRLELMVEGLFTTPEYQATNVQLAKAGSDHLAIVAEIRRA